MAFAQPGARILLLLLLVAAAYAPSLTLPFLDDDYQRIPFYVASAGLALLVGTAAQRLSATHRRVALGVIAQSFWWLTSKFSG